MGIKRPKVSFLGSWDRQTGLDDSIRKHYEKNRWRASDVLKVVTVIEPPFVSVELTPVGLKYYGYCIDLLKEIMSHLKLKYEIYNSTGYGSLMDDNWTGAVGEVVYGWVILDINFITPETSINFSKHHR